MQLYKTHVIKQITLSTPTAHSEDLHSTHTSLDELSLFVSPNHNTGYCKSENKRMYPISGKFTSIEQNMRRPPQMHRALCPWTKCHININAARVQKRSIRLVWCWWFHLWWVKSLPHYSLSTHPYTHPVKTNLESARQAEKPPRGGSHISQCTVHSLCLSALCRVGGSSTTSHW